MGIASALAMLAFPFFIFLTDDHVEGSQSFCPFKMLTGMPCPGCGITKSIVFFYEGNIYKSLSYHVLGPFTVALSVVVLITLALELITGKEYFTQVAYSRRLAYIFAFVLGIYHLVRTVYFVWHHSLHQILQESIWL